MKLNKFMIFIYSQYRKNDNKVQIYKIDKSINLINKWIYKKKYLRTIQKIKLVLKLHSNHSNNN